MGTAFRFLLIAISFLSISNRTYADSVGDTAGVRAGVILEANEIDSSTVEVGAFAVVIYGMGKRDPVTGDWEQLVTVRGYVQGVDAEALHLARKQGGWSGEIDLERIQTLVLVGSPSLKALDQISTHGAGQIKVSANRVENRRIVDRIRTEHTQTQSDSGRAAGGFQATSARVRNKSHLTGSDDSLLVRTGNRVDGD